MANRTVAQNKKARHDYFILEAFECGIVLTGTEIKSVRDGRVNLKEGYALIRNGEVWLVGVHISPYEKGSYYNHEPLRDRKLLLKRGEILRLSSKVREKGLTLVPLSMYIKEGKRAKVELGLAKGKQLFDKREAIAERDVKRDMERAVRRGDRE